MGARTNNEDTTDSAIAVRDIYKIFGNEPEAAFPYIEQGLSRKEIMEQSGQVVALKDVGFTVKPGEIFVLMGLSGSGKSTLLRMINRLQEPTRGEIIVKGKPVHQLSHDALIEFRRKACAMVFQRFALFPQRTVLGNVLFGLEVQGVPHAQARQRAMQALTTVGLAEWADTPVSSLSGGMEQRVGLARALATDAEILLMDEPFSALDPLIRTRMQDELLALQEQMGKTILFVSHDLNEAIRIGDRIGILDSEGRMVQIGRPEEILLSPANDYIASFLRDVNRPSALRAEHVMRAAKRVIGPTDPVRQAMCKDAHYIAVFEGDTFHGVVSCDAAARHEGAEAKTIAHMPQTAHEHTVLKDLLPPLLSDAGPVAVYDKDEQVVGFVEKEVVAEFLAHDVA